MVSRFLVLALTLTLIPLTAKDEARKAHNKSNRKNVDAPATTPIPPKPDCTSFNPIQNADVKADVRVTSSPAKDSYDKAAVWINALLASVGIAGIIIAIGTLKKIERQTKATEDAAKAAIDGAKATRQSVEAAREAHVAMVNRERPRVRVEVTGDWEYDANMSMVSVAYKVTCHGPTPAFIDKAVAMARARTDSEYSVIYTRGAIPLPKIFPAAEMKDQSTVMGKWPWTASELAAVRAGSLYLVFVGEIHYHDVFGISYETYFSFIRKTMDIDGLEYPYPFWTTFGPAEANRET